MSRMSLDVQDVLLEWMSRMSRMSMSKDVHGCRMIEDVQYLSTVIVSSGLGIPGIPGIPMAGRGASVKS